MPAQKLKEYLDANGVQYVTVTHSVAYTAQEIASIAHVPGKELAKTVMVKVDGKIVEGNVIPIFGGGAHAVNVVMGEGWPS